MFEFDIPQLGNLAIALVLIAASFTFAMGLKAWRGSGASLQATRWGMYATAALIVLAVCLLAYAFQTHDFRIRYVARYSDRSMSLTYLVTALWGGQDGSLLWWTFLLGGYSAAVTKWTQGRFEELQPLLLSTLASIIMFFAVLMLFAANPFATSVTAAPADGEGLNPLLQNYWMAIHPPTLYLGFVGWSVPFGFVVSALVTGRLGAEWLRASRLWAMITWTFLSVGLVLGALWSYEELGWGGYWAWDPVENASFMPWLVGTAYLHSAIVQERYGMLKVWNVFLLCLTFILTIFGTMLTRAGLISSVHAFARSDIGIYFAWYVAALLVFTAALIIWRLPKLRADHRIEAMMSREVLFLFNNWMLLGLFIGVFGLTTYPLVTEFFEGMQSSVAPAVYNHWLAIPGVMLLFLTGLGPLVAWRKASGAGLKQALRTPVIAAVATGVLLALFGAKLGYPAFVEVEPVLPGITGVFFAKFLSMTPLLLISMSAFVTAGIAQEFWRGTSVRMRKGESAWTAFTTLISKARRRYGGYVVHLGMVFMYLAWTGSAFDVEHEGTLYPGQSMHVGNYEVRYDGPQMETDTTKRAVFARLTVLSGGEVIGTATPAKFIYRAMPEMPTTEVSIRSNAVEDLYIIMSVIDPETKRGTFQVKVRPFVSLFWIGGLILILGSLISMWPEAREVVARQEAKRRTAPPAGPLT